MRPIPDKVVIGVVGDVRSSGPAGEVQHEFYLPAAQAPEASWSWIQRTLTLAVRGPGDAAALAGPTRASVRAVDPALPLHNVRTMSERLSRSLASSRFNTQLVGTLGLMALVLAAIGIYSVIAYFVTQRTHEIGIRLALGATPTQVVRLVVRQAMGPVGLGLALGVIGAVFAARLLQSQLGDVSAADRLAFGAGLALLAAVALGASLLPARRRPASSPDSWLTDRPQARNHRRGPAVILPWDEGVRPLRPCRRKDHGVQRFEASHANRRRGPAGPAHAHAGAG